MKKAAWMTLLTGPALLTTAILLTATTAKATEIPSLQTGPTETSIETFPSVGDLNNPAPEAEDTMGQLRSVTELSDVQPTDWAYEALRNLVEKYGCIAGYPDQTFRGNRALTRYEFAAGVNACLEAITAQIQPGGDFVTREDLNTLERLLNQFQAEIATLRGRVDSLETRTRELEENQFSTTTKLAGEVIIAATDGIGDGSNSTPSLQQRVRLYLNTSFTGEDLLVTRLQVGNSQSLDHNNLNNGIPYGFTTSEGFQTHQVFGNTGNNVLLDWLSYTFPVGNKFKVTVEATGGVFDDFTPTLNPFFESYDGGNGSISTFGQRNPIYRLGGGQGIGISFKPSSQLELTAGYLASEGASPVAGNGFFDGNYSALGQVTWTPSDRFGVAFTYNHAYFGPGSFGFDNGGGSLATGNLPFAGTALANTVGANSPVTSNSYGLQMSLRVSPRFQVNGWVGYTDVFLRDSDINGKIWNGAIAFAFPDLGKQGNLAGIIVGVEPYLKELDGFDNFFATDLPLHVEAFYKYQLTDNIAITPGVIWLTAPNQDNSNNDAVIGTLRTTFNF
ncbi:MAG TPA: iron uptake porin [Halomicronema sp.]